MCIRSKVDTSTLDLFVLIPDSFICTFFARFLVKMSARLYEYRFCAKESSSLIHRYFFSQYNVTSVGRYGKKRAQGYLRKVACIRRLNAPRDNEMTHPHGAISARYSRLSCSRYLRRSRLYRGSYNFTDDLPWPEFLRSQVR